MNTNSTIAIFNNDVFGKIRTVMHDGNPWFVGNDVARALGYTRPRNAVSDHCKGGIKMALPSSGGSQEVKIIPEFDVYRLILRSKLPEAERFQDWIVEEVLPSIRKDGGYIHARQEDTPEVIMAKALKLMQATIERLEAKVADAAPMVQLAEGFLTEGEDIPVSDLAKKLNQEGLPLGRDRLFAFLRGEGMLCARKGSSDYNSPTQYYMDRKWFKVKETGIRIRGDIVYKKTTCVTPKGVKEISDYIHACFE